MHAAAVEPILRSHALRLEFQPVVDLGAEEVVGYEALMRGPAGPLDSPEALIAAAQAEGVLEDLDRLARFTALFTVAREEMDPRHRLFLNTEGCADPERFHTELAILDEMAPGIQIILEITERATHLDPQNLTDTVVTARDCGWQVCLDDLGAGGSTPALLPLLKPDFVKVDQSVVQSTTAPAPDLLGPLHAYLRTSGATLIAEGIETTEHRHAARALGATWGQGWLLGRPGPLPPVVR